MKITLLFLLLVNSLFFGWSQWVAKTPMDRAVATPEPDAEPLVLFAEQFPERARLEREAIEKVARDQRLAERSAREAEAEAEALANAEAEQAAAASAELSESSSTLIDDTPPVQVAQTPEIDEPDASEPGPIDVPEEQPAAAEAPVDTPEVSRDGALTALNELAADTPEPSPSAPPLLALSADGPATARCVELGPFINLRNATQATEVLQGADLEITQRATEARVWVGHWVHLPPAESRAAAVATVEQLRTDGVSDIYIEPSGELRHSISLGLFSDAERAEIRAGKVRKLGVKPQIRDRFREGTVYWLEFELAPGQNIDPARFASSPGRDMTLSERDCNQTQASLSESV